MVTPLISSDIVAALPLYDQAGIWLGVSMGPASGDMVEVCDETGEEPRVYAVPWRLARIGQMPPT